MNRLGRCIFHSKNNKIFLHRNSPSIFTWNVCFIIKKSTDPPPTHTHTRKQRKRRNNHSRMQGKQSKMKIFGSEECKQKLKSTHTTQIIKEKTRLKNNGLARRVGWGDKINRRGRSHVPSRRVINCLILIVWPFPSQFSKFKKVF